jgi:hypothetical protein
MQCCQHKHDTPIQLLPIKNRYSHVQDLGHKSHKLCPISCACLPVRTVLSAAALVPAVLAAAAAGPAHASKLQQVRPF